LQFLYPHFFLSSLKEAIYKAAHPLLCQYVSFQEAEVTPHPDGTASCKWLLQSNADKRIAMVTAHWRRLPDDGFFLTSASVYEYVTL
jgi:4'-phosphopantetheinyl transferase EntD